MLSMKNPHAPDEPIAAILNYNMEVAFRVDIEQGKMSVDYARDRNVDGLVVMINCLPGTQRSMRM